LCLPVFFVLGVVASFFSLSATVPQLIRAARSRSVDGLSWTSLVLSLSTFTLWCVYSVAVADKIQLVNNMLAFTLLVALAVVMVRAGAVTRCWSAVVAVLGTAVLAVLLVDISNAFVLAMAGTTISSLRMLPQTRLALTRVPLWGLCPWSTVLTWLGMLMWLIYAVAVGDHALALCSAIGIGMQSTIASFRLPPRRTLASLAHGRLGRHVARVVVPVSARFPLRSSDFELAA
jgi:uncharacterized protein with PQ loop repeat